MTDTNQDATELQRLASEIIASSSDGQPQADTFTVSTSQFNSFVAMVKVLGDERQGRRRSRHCRSGRPRSLRRARDRARTKEHEATS
jgi:hypothetical protein